jgi:hypothetical protein
MRDKNKTPRLRWQARTLPYRRADKPAWLPVRHHGKESKVKIINEPGHLIVLSPHLGSAVSSCGALLSAYAGSTVLTVFAGVPEDGTPLTDWDQRCGFKDGVSAMKQRKVEDDTAMRLLKTVAVRLPFLDDQYVQGAGRARPRVEKVCTAIGQALDAAPAGTVVFPLGLFLNDHVMVSDAVLTLFASRPQRTWVAYEEVLYRNHPGTLQSRLVQFYTRGIGLTPVAFGASASVHRKATAVAAYTSQQLPLGVKRGEGDAAAPERYWLLHETVKQEPGHASA